MELNLKIDPKKSPAFIPVEVLREHVGYDPVSGSLWWKKAHVGRTLFKPFGEGSTYRYIQFGFWRRIILAHRAAFAIFHGRWCDEVDHINQNTRDNRILNLREASRGLNIANNRNPRTDSASNVRGVCPHRASGGWMAYGRRDGVLLQKYCRTLEEGIHERALIMKKLYPEINAI